MPKRVIVIAKSVSMAQGPAGQLVNVQKDVTKVVELSTTLEDLLTHAEDKQVDALTLIFESEDPEARNPVKPKLVT